MTDPLLPSAVSSEETILGAILLDPRAAMVAIERLDPSDFYKGGNRKIFEACRIVFERDQNLDAVLVAGELETSGDLEGVGGLLGLMDLAGQVATSANVESHIQLVQEAAKKRRIGAAATDLARGSFQPTESANELLARAYLALDGIADTTKRVVTTVRDMLQGLFDDLTGKETNPVFLTGLIELDQKMGGMSPGELVIIAARPGGGKTTFACHLIRQWAAAGKKIAFLSYEMPREQISRILAAGQAGVAIDAKTGAARDEFKAQTVIDACQEMSGWEVELDDCPPAASHLLAYCRGLQRRGVEVIVLDYLQEVPNDTDSDTREQEVAYVARTLKRAAREMKILVVACAQLNRGMGATNARPTLSRLRESGAIEQTTDIVLFLHNTDESQALSIEVEAIIAKNRNGGTGDCKLRWEKGWRQFTSYELPPPTPARDYTETAERVSDGPPIF